MTPPAATFCVVESLPASARLRFRGNSKRKAFREKKQENYRLLTTASPTVSQWPSTANNQ
jgi:hypothetical protein